MKKIMLMVIAAGLLASCTSCRFNYKNEHVRTETVTQVKDFEKIEMLGSMDVEYMQSDSFEISVTAPDAVMKKVETVVNDHTLQIRMRGSNRLFHFGDVSSGGVKVTVKSPDLIGVKVSGSGDFVCQGLLDTDVLDINLVGSGDVTFQNVICDQVNVNLVGSGDVDVKNVRTQKSSMELIGSGDIKMNFGEARIVDARLVGSGDITLLGHVDMLKSSVHGSGDLDTDKLTIKNEQK